MHIQDELQALGERLDTEHRLDHASFNTFETEATQKAEQQAVTVQQEHVRCSLVAEQSQDAVQNDIKTICSLYEIDLKQLQTEQDIYTARFANMRRLLADECMRQISSVAKA